MIHKWDSRLDNVLEDRTVWPNPAETRRMALFAKGRGVRLMLRKDRDGRPLSATVVDPRDDRPHAVSLLSCDCPLFAACQGCQHHSLLVATLNVVPEVVIESVDVEKAMVLA